jgi:hypothetical protein
VPNYCVKISEKSDHHALQNLNSNLTPILLGQTIIRVVWVDLGIAALKKIIWKFHAQLGMMLKKEKILPSK